MKTDSLKNTETVTLGYGTQALREEKIANPAAWIGIDFNTSLGNYAGDTKKKKRKHEFYDEC